MKQNKTKFTLILTMTIIGIFQMAFAKDFYDIENSFAKEDIMTFVKKGIIHTGESLAFRPEDPITRIEFLALATKALGKPIDELLMTTDYADVQISWEIKFVEKAKDYGIKGVELNGKRYFQPDKEISRAEAMAMLLNLKGVIPNECKKSSFADINVPWIMKYVEKSKELGIIKGQTIDGKLKFRPDDSMTRAEAVKIISKAMSIK